MRYTILSALLVLALPGPGSAEVLASVDDATLTWDDLILLVGGEENSQYLAVGSTAEAEEMLRSWVREQLVVSAAQSSGLASRPDVAFAIDQAVRQILLEAFLTEAAADVQISLLEVENYVSAWGDSYRNEVHARHILLPDRTLAQTVLARLQSGESFETLASEYSVCPSAAQGGDLGWLRRGQAVLAFEEAAFSLAPGALSPVVETSMGFHVIKVLETRPLTPAPTDAQIFQLAGEELTADAQEAALMGILDSLEASHAVAIYPDRLLQHMQD